jgi:hypothetical protein
MSAYTEFFLKSKSSVVQLELLEISHPNFSKIYYLVRNATNGVTVTLEDTSVHTFDYCPMKTSLSNDLDDLDQIIKIQLGDLGEIVPNELDLVEAANGFGIKPTLKYRTFRSDDLLNVLYGPIVLEIKQFTFNKQGALFEAKAPSLNINKTGEIYAIDRFPMLRGLL